MSAEQLSIQGLPTDLGSLENSRKVAQKMEYGQELQKLVDPNDYLAQVSQDIEEGTFVTLVSNHNQHLNIAGMRKVLKNLQVKPQETNVVVAYSLLNDGQDPKIVNFAKGLMPLLEPEDTYLVPLARPQDVFKLRAEKKKEEALKAMRATRNNISYIHQSLEREAGLILFPEATTEGAVKGKKGKRHGMVEIEGEFVFDLLTVAKEMGRKVVLLPIGMVGTNKIVEPRTSKPHMRTMFEIGKEKTAEYLGVDLGPIKPIASIVVGEPFSIEETRDSKEVNDTLGRRIAELLPEEARGFYGDNYDPNFGQELKPGKLKRLFEY